MQQREVAAALLQRLARDLDRLHKQTPAVALRRIGCADQ